MSENNVQHFTLFQLKSEVPKKFTTTAFLHTHEPNLLKVKNITLFGWADNNDFHNHGNNQIYSGSLKRIQLKITASGRLWPDSRKRPRNKNVFYGLPYSSEDSITNVSLF